MMRDAPTIRMAVTSDVSSPHVSGESRRGILRIKNGAMKSLVGARYLANDEGASGNVCTLQFFRSGFTRVHWRKELTLRDETAGGVLTLPSGIHGIECQGEGLTSWVVKHRRDATILLL